MDARKQIDEWLDEQVQEIEIRQEVGGDPREMDRREAEIRNQRDMQEIEAMRQTWGKTPEARQGLANATQLGWTAAE
jgi:hypothetical protein